MDKANESISVQVNEKKVQLPIGSTISDALAAAGYEHFKNTIIGIVAGREEMRKEVATEFRVFTTKGELNIELTDDTLKHIWLESYGRLIGTKVKWTTGPGNSVRADRFQRPGRQERVRACPLGRKLRHRRLRR